MDHRSHQIQHVAVGCVGEMGRRVLRLPKEVDTRVTSPETSGLRHRQVALAVQTFNRCKYVIRVLSWSFAAMGLRCFGAVIGSREADARSGTFSVFLFRSNNAPSTFLT